MASSTIAGASNWREVFLAHPGLPVTPENYDRLLEAGAGAAPEPAPEPEPEPDPEPEPADDPKPARMSRGSLA